MTLKDEIDAWGDDTEGCRRWDSSQGARRSKTTRELLDRAGGTVGKAVPFSQLNGKANMEIKLDRGITNYGE